VAAAGGWKSKETLLNIYQQADDASILSVVLGGRQLWELRAWAPPFLHRSWPTPALRRRVAVG